jgi:competence protein ComEA
VRRSGGTAWLWGILLLVGGATVASAQQYEEMLSEEERQEIEAALPDEPGKKTLLRVCGTCHSMVNVIRNPRSKERWNVTIGLMINRGAQGADEEFDEILEYLAKNVGPRGAAAAPLKINVNQAAAKELVAALDLSAEEAEAVVSHREKNGRYKEWQDLTKVQGLDAKKIEAKKDRLTF